MDALRASLGGKKPAAAKPATNVTALKPKPARKAAKRVAAPAEPEAAPRRRAHK